MFPSSSQPYEEAGKKVNSIAFFTKISTYSLTKRPTLNQLLLHRWTQYFNSQPHEEADECLVTPLVEMLHFNSQPHEEADMLLNFIKLLVFYFNSQPHEEADLKVISSHNMIHISTHSLTKRLTKLRPTHY